MSRCLKCNARLSPDDKFCWWDGTKLIGFTASLSQKYYFLGPEALGAPPVELQLKLTGIQTVHVHVDEPTSQFVSFAQPLEQNPVPLGETSSELSIPLKIAVASAPSTIHDCRLTLWADDGSDPLELQLLLVPWPRWKIDLELPRQAVTFEAHKHVWEFSGMARLETGGALVAGVTVKDNLQDTPRLFSLRFSNFEPNEWFDVRPKQKREIPFTLSVDCRRLRELFCVRGEELDKLEAVIEITCQAPETSFTAKFVLPILWPPLLAVPDADRFCLENAFPGRRREVETFLNNCGERDLTILDIRLRDTLTWVKIEQPRKFPLKVHSGKGNGELLKLQFDTHNLPYGKYETALEIKSDCCKQPLLTLPVQLTLRELRFLDGVVAIDFGNTSSCCAIFNSEKRFYDIIDLESRKISESERKILPSAILYNKLEIISLPGDQKRLIKTYVVGRTAKYFLEAPDNQRSGFYSIKRYLGWRPPLHQPFKVYFRSSNNYLPMWPEDIVGDFLQKGILQVVEDRFDRKIQEIHDLKKDLDEKFNKRVEDLEELLLALKEYQDLKKTIVTITHPARFSHWQMEALKKAFKRCGVVVDYHLSEPVAAALDYISSRPPASRTYTAVVFDFGGGSTDIALLKVTETVQPDGDRHIQPEIIDLDGDPYFGGDNLTDKLAWEMIRRAYEIIRSRDQIEPGKDQTSGHNDLPDFPPLDLLLVPTQNDWVLKTWNKAWGEAEEFKISDKLDYMGNVTLFSPQGDEIKQPIRINKLEFETMIRPDLERQVKNISMLLKDHKVDTLEVILLAGRSCRLSLVRNLIEEFIRQEHPEAETHLAGQAFMPQDQDAVERPGEAPPTRESLKECVALGACLFGRLKRAERSGGIAADVAIEPKGELRLACSSFGVEGYDAGMRSIFKEVVRMGSKVAPEEWPLVPKLKKPTNFEVWENMHRHNNSMDSNKLIQLVGKFILPRESWDKLSEIPREKCYVEMRLNEQHEVEARLRIRDRDEWYPFQREF